MTERTYKETKYALTLVLVGTVAIMGFSGIGYIHVGEHVYVDFSMIPAAVLLVVSGYRTNIAFGITWGILSCFTHPLADDGSYLLILLSQIIFSLAIVVARELHKKKKVVIDSRYPVMVAIAVHGIVFDLIGSQLNELSTGVPIVQVIAKILITGFCYYMTTTVLSKQLHEVYVSTQSGLGKN